MTTGEGGRTGGVPGASATATATATAATDATGHEDLHMMQLSDSFFPTGMFATSNGIETLFLEKKVATAEQLLEMNRITIRQQLGPCDCTVLANAYDCAANRDYGGLAGLDAAYCAMRTNKESRQASVRSGGQLVRCTQEFLDGDKTLDWYAESLRSKAVPGSYPVAMAVCCNALHIGKARALGMLLYGSVVSSVGAAMRLGMIHHLEAQRIIHQLKPLISETAGASMDRPVSEAWQFAPQLEIFQMIHEQMDSKMFVT